MDSNQFREAAQSAVEEIITYYDTIADRRVVSNVEPGYLKKLLPDGPPEEGEPWADIQKDIEQKIMPGITHWQSPNFMAFYPANATFPSMLGELYSAALTAPAFNWICSPAVTELETIVLDWMATLLALPQSYKSSTHGGGVIQGSASEAVVTTMVASRDKYLRETTSHLTPDTLEWEDTVAHKRSKMVAVGSEATHSSGQKAAQIAGVRYRSIPITRADGYSLTAASVEKTLKECKEAGLEPFFLILTLGTTSTCSVDDFEGIQQVLGEMSPPDKPGSLWVHVDAAYAGSALVCPEYQHLTKHFDKFHSFNMNMHKWLLTNFDASLLYVRERKDLTDSLSIMPSYLKNSYSESGLVTDYRDWQIPLGRRFRSLKIWFVLRSYGVKGLQAHIRRCIDMGDGFAKLVEKRSDLFEIITGPSFALTTLAVKARGEDTSLEAQNRLTETVYEQTLKQGEVYLTGNTLPGNLYVIRVVSASPSAEAKYLQKAFDILVATAEEIRDGKLTNGKAV